MACAQPMFSGVLTWFVFSSHALPEQYRKLMTDPNSPIIDFYPTGIDLKALFWLIITYYYILHMKSSTLIFISSFLLDFEVDMNGKRFSWQVCFLVVGSYFTSTTMALEFLLIFSHFPGIRVLPSCLSLMRVVCLLRWLKLSTRLRYSNWLTDRSIEVHINFV